VRKRGKRTGYICAECPAEKKFCDKDQHTWVTINFRWECAKCPATKPYVCTQHQWYKTRNGSFFTRAEYTCLGCGEKK